jgi:ArsR family transcriptional regulator
MDETSRAKFAARARIVKALGHPSRLAMVEELARGERCVCELRELVGTDLSTVSKHLTLLKNAGIVEDDKRGVQVFYRLKVPCVLNFFGCIEAVLQNQAREARRIAQ